MDLGNYANCPYYRILKEVDLYKVQKQLKKRLIFPYQWHKKQNNLWDKNSNFIYNTPQWEALLEKIKRNHGLFPNEKQAYFDYCANRWYNFNSALAVEHIFCSCAGISAHPNSKHKKIDFTFFGINFDHKTSVFPASFGKSLEYARQHKRELIGWLYQNQSKQNRKHFENRLFLIVYSHLGSHWKLKSEIVWLKTVIENYVAIFKAPQLEQFEFEPGKKVVSDIIWAIK